MTGLYPDIPGYRFNLATEGIHAFVYNASTNGARTIITPAQLAACQDLDTNVALPGAYATENQTTYHVFVFPEPRDLRGLRYHYDGGSVTADTFMYSLDSTDGENGTWAAAGISGGASMGAGSPPWPGYRSAIGAVSLDGVRAIRLRLRITWSGNTPVVRALHIYGQRPQNIHRLAFWHPTDDLEVPGSYFDFGDTPRNAIYGGRAFRLKNLSTTKTATGVQVNAVSLAGSGFGPNGLEVSDDNAVYGPNTAPIALIPGEIGPLHYARLNLTDPAMAVQARSGRLTTSLTGYAA